MASADLSQLTAIIPASNRQKSLTRLVRSLRKGYPELRILVADDSQEALTCKQADSIRLPVGIGRSAACNALLSRLRTPYFLLLDDRCELAKETRLEALLDLVAGDKLDVAAGDLLGCERRFWFFVRRRPASGHGTFEIAGDLLALHRGHRTVGEGYAWCDMVPNFFVARTEKVRDLGGWDPELKNDEREEFFMRGHRQGLRVGLASEVVALQWNDRNASSDLERPPCLKNLATAKMGLSQMTDFDGQVFRAPRRVAAA